MSKLAFSTRGNASDPGGSVLESGPGGRTMVIRHSWLLAATATVALLAAAPAAMAQDSTETPPAATDAQPAPAQGAAPATTPDAAAATPPAPPADGAAAPSAPAASDAQAPADGATKLPDVEVVQPQPAPQPAPEATEEPPKVVVKKRPAPAAAAPAPVAKAKPKPQPAPAAEPVDVAEPVATPTQAELPAAAGGPPAGDTLVRMSPVAGSEIPLEKVPAAVGRATAADIARDGSRQVQNVLQQQVPASFCRTRRVAGSAPMSRIAVSMPHQSAGARRLSRFT